MDRGHKQGCSRLGNRVQQQMNMVSAARDSVIECMNAMDGTDGQEKVQGIETHVRILCYPPYNN